MDAMGKMLANMLGITPDEIAAMAQRVQDGLLAMAKDLNEIKQQNMDIMCALERIENGPGNSGSRKPGKSAGDGGKLNGGITLTPGSPD